MNLVRPYLGLRPYEYKDRDSFFGRDDDCEILTDKLLANRLTLLFAASGVGKTSLLNAAVLPRLRDPLGENLTVVYHNDWVLNPLEALSDSIRSEVPNAAQAPEGQTLAELLAFSSLFTRHPFVIVLDQFEEFFRYQRGKGGFKVFIQQLTAVILNAEIPVSLVVSMREDFALELNAFKSKLPILLFENYYRLEKMTSQAAQDAIIKPAAQHHFSYEPALLDCLIDDLSSQQRQHLELPHQTEAGRERYVEPAHLQIVCEYLWEQNQNNPDNTLHLASYEKAGKANGIVQQFLNTVLRGFSTAEKHLVSKAFDYLAAQGGVKMAYPAHTLANIIKANKLKLAKVLDKLAGEDVRILRKQTRAGVAWYELYHDMFSPSVEQWNNDRKAKLLRKQKWISRSLGALLLVGSIILADSLWWIYKHKFPVEELFTQQVFRLMSLGIIDEPTPVNQMVRIIKPIGKKYIGEFDLDMYKSIQEKFKRRYGFPVVEAKIQTDFELSQFEVTYQQFDYFVWSMRGSPDNDVHLSFPGGAFPSNSRGTRAVTNVSWKEAIEYTRWLSKKTNQEYRLPTEAEWEYSARGGSTKGYWWNEESVIEMLDEDSLPANCKNCAGEVLKKAVDPVGSYMPGPNQLHDMLGNVWELTCSEYGESFDGREQRCTHADYNFVTVRGGSWKVDYDLLRLSARGDIYPSDSENDVGFRVLRVINE